VISPVSRHSEANVPVSATPSSTRSPGNARDFEQQLLLRMAPSRGESYAQIQEESREGGEQILAARAVPRPIPATEEAPAEQTGAAPPAATGLLGLLQPLSSAAQQYDASIAQAGYNPAQYADPVTAQALAQFLGGTVAYTQVGGQVSPPSQAMISFGNGQEVCAGLLEQQIEGAKNIGMSETALETEIAADLSQIGVAARFQDA